MIAGHVEDLEGLVRLTFTLAEGRTAIVEFVVDTGFAGDLTLPVEDIERFNLEFFGEVTAQLADGQRVVLASHQAAIKWQGGARDVLVLATRDRPLLGNSLLKDQNLSIDFRAGGKVRIKPLRGGASLTTSGLDPP